MDISVILLAVIIILLIIILIQTRNSRSDAASSAIRDIMVSIKKIEDDLKIDFRMNREESAKTAKDNRDELRSAVMNLQQDLRSVLENSFRQNRESLDISLQKFAAAFQQSVQSFNQLQQEKFASLEKKQNELITGTEKKLEQMRETVDEKLQRTLHERLSRSFETVGHQLAAVQEGLGEMKNLAQDVGGLKKVLANVKQRGSFGEVQLSMLLEQILAPDQYEANVKTKQGSAAVVEFAIKLPGRETSGTHVWLPVDAKFPKDVYEQLQNAHDKGDPAEVDSAQNTLYAAVKKMAKDIQEKYIDPPSTTDFAIMFLPFEGIYAEVVRKSALLEELQRVYKVIVTGPATLAAILNSLQMGFRTLAIQKRSSEVWQVLADVKKEFENFGGMLQKAQQNIQTGLTQLDDVMGKRTRAIQRKLRDVEGTGTKLIDSDE